MSKIKLEEQILLYRKLNRFLKKINVQNQKIKGNKMQEMKLVSQLIAVHLTRAKKGGTI